MHEQVADLRKEGDALASAGRLDDARQNYIAALKLLPGEPRHWEAATWIYVALGDAHFRSQNFDKAADELMWAHMAGGIDIFMEDDPKYLEFLETRVSL